MIHIFNAVCVSERVHKQNLEGNGRLRLCVLFINPQIVVD